MSNGCNELKSFPSECGEFANSFKLYKDSKGDFQILDRHGNDVTRYYVIIERQNAPHERVYEIRLRTEDDIVYRPYVCHPDPKQLTK